MSKQCVADRSATPQTLDWSHLVASVGLLLVWTFAGCAGGDSSRPIAEGDDTGGGCDAGVAQSCDCPGETTGTRTCEDDGSGWSDCNCESDAGSVDTEPADTGPATPPPEIESIESASDPMPPGESVRVVVVAGASGESSSGAGSLRRSRQGLQHDAAVVDVEAPDVEAPDADASDTSVPPMDVTDGADARNADASNDAEPTPEPLQGDVPSDWTVEWSVDGDDWAIEGQGASAVLEAPDTYDAEAMVDVTVTDPTGRSASAELVVGTGANAVPRIDGLTASPNPVAPRGTIDVSVEARDDRGDALAYTWRAPDGWTITSPSARTTTVKAPDEEGSLADLRVEVRDEYGGQTSSSIRIETTTNAAPVLGSVTASPPQVAPKGTITLEASANDAEDDSLSYTWDLPSNWRAASTSGSTIQVRAPDTYGASGTARVTVEDTRGATASGRVVVSTHENDGPRITTLNATPRSVARGGTIDLEVTASDPNGDPLSYAWSVQKSATWTLTENGDEAQVTSPQTSGVSTRVEVTVSDGEGGTATASRVVSTRPNRAPVLSSVTAQPRTLSPKGTTTLRASAQDPNGDSLSYQWTVPSQWSKQGSGAKIDVTAPDKYGLQATIELTVEDGHGGEATGSVVVSTKQNRPPVVSSVAASPQMVQPKGTITVRATASDPDGQTLDYNWSVPSGWSQSGQGEKITLTAPDAFGVSDTVRVTVEDGAGGKATGGTTIETVRNEPPVVSSLTANPPVVRSGGTTSLEVLASDPNGDSLSYKWTVPTPWTKSGQGDTIQVMAPKQKRTSARIRVEVSDGNGGTTRSAVVVRTPLNAPPIIQSLTANPTTLEPGQKTTVQAQANDPDNDPLTFRWDLPKGWNGSSTTNTIDVTAPRTYSASVDVTLEVDDGFDTTTRSVGVKTVANEKPVVTSFTVQPEKVQLGQQATAEIQASDPLGDSLTYDWSISNKDWTISGSGSSVALTAPSQPGPATLTVTVKDGFGGEVTKTKTIRAVERLYSFSKHRFTPCGASGRTGPSQSDCRNTYNTSWDDNGSYFQVDNPGIQEWTVPESATYEITVAGARGGLAHDDRTFGKGAVLTSQFQLQKGETLHVLVGQKGSTAPRGTNDWWNSSGGGGTFVYYDASDNEPLIVAGGGGGGSHEPGKHPRMDASLSTSGHDGIDSGGSRGGAGGTNGQGGQAGSGNPVAGAGGGWLSDGQGAQNSCGYTVEDGSTPRNGGYGGEGGNRQNGGGNYPGGFGGGGGGTGACGSSGAGAGGGYSGGGTGDDCCDSRGGGGGSFSRNKITSSSVSNTGDGYVIIEKQ